MTAKQKVLMPSLKDMAFGELNLTRKKRSICVGALSGGVGKTLMAQVIAMVCRGTNRPMHLISVDTPDAGGSLDKLMANFTNVTVIDPRRESGVMNSASRVSEPALSDVFGYLAAGDVIVDFGALVFGNFVEWLLDKTRAGTIAVPSMIKAANIDTSGVLDQFQDTDVVFVMIAAEKSAREIDALIDRIQPLRRLMNIHPVVVINKPSSFVSQDARIAAHNIIAKAKKLKVPVRYVANCDISTFERMNNSSVTLIDALFANLDNLHKQIGGEYFAMIDERPVFVHWISDNINMVLSLKLATGEGTGDINAYVEVPPPVLSRDEDDEARPELEALAAE